MHTRSVVIGLTSVLASAIAMAAAPPANAALNQNPQCLVREVQIPMTAGYTFTLPVGEVAADPEGRPVRLLSFTDDSIWQAGTAWIDDNGTPAKRTDDSFVYQRPSPLGSRSTQKFSIVVSDGAKRTTCLLDITVPRSGLG